MLDGIRPNMNYAQYYATKVNASKSNPNANQASEKILSPYEFQSKTQCQTCQNRTYQDGSDDSGVSFQSPTKVDPKSAASAVKSHENEHVVREQAKAEMESRSIVYQSVRIHTSVCSECNKVYVSGGTTYTQTKKDVQEAYNVDNNAKATIALKA